MKSLPLTSTLILAGCASTQPSDDAGFEAMLMGKAPRATLSAEQAAAVAKHPLGSPENPVLAEGPPGQRAYLLTLRCPEGRAPTFDRGGSAGLSPYGSIMDVYQVACDAPPMHSVFIDMYHPGHIEKQAVPGFTIVATDGT
jgi:hypothetical protein